MLTQFSYHLPTKIFFGQPALESLQNELANLGAKKILLISDSGLAQLGMVEQFANGLNKAGFSTTPFTDVSSNPTTTEVATGLEIAINWLTSPPTAEARLTGYVGFKDRKGEYPYDGRPVKFTMKLRREAPDRWLIADHQWLDDPR